MPTALPKHVRAGKNRVHRLEKTNADPLRVYLAAPYGTRDSLAQAATAIRDLGFVVVSSWLEEPFRMTPGSTGPAPDLKAETLLPIAVRNLVEVASADVLVMMGPDTWSGDDAPLELAAGGSTSGGRHLEMGYALACDLPVINVGAPENIFSRTLATVADSWEDALELLVLTSQNLDYVRHTRDQGLPVQLQALARPTPTRNPDADNQLVRSVLATPENINNARAIIGDAGGYAVIQDGAQTSGSMTMTVVPTDVGVLYLDPDLEVLVVDELPASTAVLFTD